MSTSRPSKYQMRRCDVFELGCYVSILVETLFRWGRRCQLDQPPAGWPAAAVLRDSRRRPEPLRFSSGEVVAPPWPRLHAPAAAAAPAQKPVAPARLISLSCYTSTQRAPHL